MGLFSFLKRRSELAQGAVVDAGDTVSQARRRARQRLTGAVVLVSAGVVGFPLLFETQPRPLSVNTPVEIARKDPAAPRTRSVAAAGLAPVPAPIIIHETAADAGREVVRPSAPASALPLPPKPVGIADPKPAVEKPRTALKPTPAASSTERPKKTVVSAEEDERFVVQVAAYSDASAAREARKKIEKLGLKTYTQVIETASGQRVRVRVGPFASRASADQAAQKLKAAGMSSSVSSL